MRQDEAVITQDESLIKKDDAASEHPHTIPIWLFIGSLLLVYGVLIFGAGVFDLLSPQKYPVALSKLHAGIWWGMLLIVIGGFYCYKFRPTKRAN